MNDIMYLLRCNFYFLFVLFSHPRYISDDKCYTNVNVRRCVMTDVFFSRQFDLNHSIHFHQQGSDYHGYGSTCDYYFAVHDKVTSQLVNSPINPP